MNKTYVTKQGYQKMSDELHRLTTEETKNALNLLQEARDKGDIAENAEYETAKEFHESLISKIKILQEKVRNVEIISVDKNTDKVNMLSTVEIKNHKTNKTVKWTLVPENEIDIKSGKISFNSPIGSSLLGKKKGDFVDVEVPAGKMKLEILNIGFDYKF